MLREPAGFERGRADASPNPRTAADARNGEAAREGPPRPAWGRQRQRAPTKTAVAIASDDGTKIHRSDCAPEDRPRRAERLLATMDLLALPDTAVHGLRARNIPADAELPIRLIATCLRDICEMVAEDCGPDRYDTAQSEGQLRYWRTRSRIVRELHREYPDLAGVRAVETDNALQLAHGPCTLAFYAARDGVERPRLSMHRKTQRRLVDQMQGQLAGLSDPQAVLRLAVMYQADERGLVEVAVGVLASPRDWSWKVVVFSRSDGDGEAVRPVAPSPPATPSYREQPVPDLPEITPRRHPATAEPENA